jgi:hypothetical protein
MIASSMQIKKSKAQTSRKLLKGSHVEARSLYRFVLIFL